MGFRVIGIDVGSKKAGVLDSGAEHFVDATAPRRGSGYRVRGHEPGVRAGTVDAADRRRAGVRGDAGGRRRADRRRVSGGDDSRGQRILSSAVGNRREAIETLEMATRGVVKVPVRTVAMGELQSVFEEMEKGTIVGRVVLDLSTV
ncbi:hypothetical protein NUW58_g10299 [Xylaria curta]|uniref:Uncharacterized protein n=1 Tax=Xylaria curta TaxID=42375 RepID=A0ACC1MN52_9PEZI|nr:hypothetical protein NUW58_g10299 [Xylaria curta]